MQEKVYKKQIKDIDELSAHILTAWDKMDQRVIDKAVRHVFVHALKLKADTLTYIASVMCFANGTVLTTRHMC